MIFNSSMTDLTFLKALREKLKGGNIRSIHLNALPGRYATRLDFTNLNFIQPKLAERFLEQLFNKACFDFQISFDRIDITSIPTEDQKRLGLLSKRLNSLFIENEDNYKEHGTKTFGFGFPILIKPSHRDPAKIIKAPIFIWQLELVKSTNKVNTWSILRNKIKSENGQIKDEEIHSVNLNEVLLSFLKTDENISIPQINEELLEDAIIDSNELIDECFKVLKALNGQASASLKEALQIKLNEPLINIPETSSLESISNNLPWIYFGGVFGLYKTQKESIITDIDKLIEKFNEFEFDNLKIENFTGTAHSAIETDPSQQEILSTLGIEPKKIIQGPPGTGKSQSLTALITNALANNLKCLVVCEKKTALDIIKRNLHRENDQLGVLAAVVEDIGKDRDGIVNSVRDRLGNLFQAPVYPETFYHKALELVETKSRDINEQHRELGKMIFQGKTWTQLVGDFIKINSVIDFTELKDRLDYRQFKFQQDETELPNLVNKIKVAKRLFSEIRTLNHPLNILSDQVFANEISKAVELQLKELEKNMSIRLQEIKNQLLNDISAYETWLNGFYLTIFERIESLTKELNLNVNEYKNWLNNYYQSIGKNVEKLIKNLDGDIINYKNWLDKHYESYYWKLKQKIKEYKLFSSSNYERFGELFYKNNQFTKIKIKAFSSFSKKYKELENNRLSLVEKILEVKESHLSFKYFKHDYLEENNYKTLRIYVDNINALETSAEEWYENNIKLKEDYVKGISSNFLHPNFENIPDIINTETSYQKFVEHIKQDEKLTSSLQGNTPNHFAKIEALNFLQLQLKAEEEIKKFYLQRYSSNALHPHFEDDLNKIIEAEKNYKEFIYYIKNDKQLFVSEYENESHYSKIEELQTLLPQLDRQDLFKKFYKKKFSSVTMHIHYNENIGVIKSTESLFEQIIFKLNSDKILKRDLIRAEFHDQKIEDINTLISEMKTISDNIESFREYFEWRKFFMNLPPLHQTVIKSLIETECNDWENTFTGWYYFWLLAIVESNLKKLPKDSYDLLDLKDAKVELKTNQIRSILSQWSRKQQQSVKDLLRIGGNPISLFNKRGARGERRNSLRKIIKTDFKLFTDFFPVVMLSPSVCSSIIPLTEGIFDIVIFDEASQLRLEDTFPALVRGKIKVVSGDSQQMPPSNYFQGGTALLNPIEEDFEEEQSEEMSTLGRNVNNSLELADSESLLVYAENCNYKQSYLKIHYRSHHPYLIDFSNHAFYGKRLIPMPAKLNYKPIQFIQVNGIYEDQINKDEARQVVDILLNHIKPFKDGNYPSVGVATFNLYQRNLILEEIIKMRQQNPENDKKFADLGSDFFVKNLENIQGDERDIIIISSTFGRRPDGTFRQNFGPIVQGKGYKLLNVIVTRAKFKVFVCCSIPQNYIKQYSTLLQKSKNTGRAILYAYLTYAKAVSDNNTELKEILLNQLYENCESRSFDIEDIYGSESPFEEEVCYRLAQKIGQARLQQQFKIGGFRIDLIIKSKVTDKPMIAIECDGAKYHNSNEAYAWDMFRQSQLEKQGLVFYRIWSTNWWYSADKELKRLVDFIFKIDNQEEEKIDIPLDEVLVEDIIVPITVKSESKEKVSLSSIVTVKNPEGKILKVKFSKTQAIQNSRPSDNGTITIYENSPLALSIRGRSEGEVCQLGMLEMYYEILKIE
jgi:hypothetical protein